MQVIKETMTPERANELLSRNTKNRGIRRHHLRNLTSAILNGDWRLTHQSIAIDVEGNLLDGQHRLMAVVRANTAVPMLVTYGADRETYGLVDQGARRTVRDHFGRDYLLAPGIAFLGRITFHDNPTLTAMERVDKALKPFTDQLNGIVGRQVKVFSAGPVKAAAIMATVEGVDALRTIDTYNGLVSIDTLSGVLPEVAHAFIKQVVGGYHVRGSKGESVLFAKAIRVFRHEDVSKAIHRLAVHTGEAEVVKARTKIQELL